MSESAGATNIDATEITERGPRAAGGNAPIPVPDGMACSRQR
ncbi:MAG TPA: hypothetical protein VF294_14745 [Polyangiaceae bacterium]